MKSRLSTQLKSLALSVALIGSTGLVFAQANDFQAPAGAPLRAEKMRHHKGCGAMKQLNLSEDQKQKLKAQQQAFRQENASLIAEMKGKFQQLRQLPKTPEAQSQRTALRAELKKDKEVLHSKHIAMLQQVLTPEQLQKYEAQKKQCRANWKKNHPKPAAK